MKTALQKTKQTAAERKPLAIDTDPGTQGYFHFVNKLGT